MAATVEPGFFDHAREISSVGTYRSAEMPYFVFNAVDEDDAIEAVRLATDAFYEGMHRDAVVIDERINEGTFKVLVRYRLETFSLGQGGSTPDPVTTFDTSGGTQHITQSLATQAAYPAGAPDCDGAIGYDGESVAGADIITPLYNFTETHWMKPSDVDESFRETLARMTGKVNDATFRGFAPGEVLFLGAAGTRRGDDSDDLWEIRYSFAMSPNRSSFTVGTISVASKKGWDYMWVRYQDEVDAAASQVVKRPVAVYIEQVYESGNFSALGI